MIQILPLLFALLATPEPTWQRHASPVTDDLHNAFFVDDSNGWILAHRSGAVLHTTDGGASWKVQARLGEGFLESIYFLDARTGWICGDKGRLYRTADAGASWEDRSLKKDELSLYSLRFLDARRGFLAGLDTAARKGVLFETSDGGETWARREDLAAPPTDALTFPSPSTGSAAGFNAILATRDGGRTWKAVHEAQGAVVRGIFFLDERTGWAVGHNGLVLQTKNSGETWEPSPPFTRNRLRSVFFLDAKRGWIAGDATEADPGVLFETTDGGTVWNRVEIKTPDLHRFAKSPGRLWIVGKGGTILALPASMAAEPFPGLRKIEYEDYFPVTISYDPEITEVVNKPLNAGPEHEGEPLVTRALKTKIDRAKSEEVFIDFDPGPSADPSIVITRVGAAEPAGYISGLDFYIPGTGAIYASGHTNTMFDTRRKYVLQGGQLVEVKQPFYWVGLESRAKKDLVLYSGKDGKETVARLPKGSALTVVLNEGEDWYLIKTPFGLVGWLKIEGFSQEADTIEGLYFRGD